MNQSVARRALVSVSDKTGLVDFVRQLVGLGFEIISTGGTRRTLEQAEIAVQDVSDYTGFPEVMDGRLKTLHPKVHGAILGRPDLPDDMAVMREHGIIPFELVVCNLYPFEQTIAKEGVTIPQAIEQIDIGGPSMVRSAAKNHAYVGIVSHPSQYSEVLEALKTENLDESFRRKLAAAAFEMTACYDRGISDYMARIVAEDANADAKPSAFPESLRLTFQRESQLRYGENPHQQAAFYVEPNADPATLAGSKQLHGKELSYNNLLDLEAALSIVREFHSPASVVIKHNNPCGCGIGETLSEAFEKAYAGDPISAFGSVIGFNRPLDLATAELLCEPNRFVEAILAPEFSDEAFEILTTRPKWKKNVRLLACASLAEKRPPSHDYRRVSGGMLVQDRDEQLESELEWKCVTKLEPTDAQLLDLKFAWTICKHVKSNAIVFVKEGAVVGVGAGQMSRLDSAFIAAHKAGERSVGGVVASDAFFPFRDGIDEVSKAGLTAVIQPGGSRNDPEVIDACNEHGMAMIFTGRRHFKH